LVDTNLVILTNESRNWSLLKFCEFCVILEQKCTQHKKFRPNVEITPNSDTLAANICRTYIGMYILCMYIK
jgi:benzoyl-CoA reductase/2-hydroxyglutaryl-CoA dehydratase subunit BcrC/BadD/HgdB